MNRMLAVIMTLSLLTCSAGAATFDVTADVNDREWRTDGSAVWVGQKAASIGYPTSNDTITSAFIMPFALPDIGGDTILSANLRVGSTDSAWGLSLSGDLYGVRVNASSTTAAGDFYAGPWDTSGTNGAALQQAYATKVQGNPAPANPRIIDNDATGNAALVAWLQSLYDGGAQPGDFVFLRINCDQASYGPTSNSYIYFYTANSTAATDIAGGTTLQLPTLQLVTGVPEPTTMVLFALGSIALLRRRRANR